MSATEQNTSREIEEYFEKQLERTNYWLSFAEAKNAGLIAVNIALLAVVIELFSDAPVFCVIVAVLILLSSVMCLVSFSPDSRSKPKGNNAEKEDRDYNLVYYREIASLQKTEVYEEKVLKKYFKLEDTISKLAHDLADEIMINSQIAVNKYKYFLWGLRIDLIAILLVGALFIAA